MNDGERGLPRVPMARDASEARSTVPDRHLPPSREQLPLPRRHGQSHLEPQLREPGGAGSGTPFEAFDTDDGTEAGTGEGDAGDATPATPPSGERVARFRDAVRHAVTGSPRRAG